MRIYLHADLTLFRHRRFVCATHGHLLATPCVGSGDGDDDNEDELLNGCLCINRTPRTWSKEGRGGGGRGVGDGSGASEGLSFIIICICMYVCLCAFYNRKSIAKTTPRKSLLVTLCVSVCVCLCKQKYVRIFGCAFKYQ